MAMLRLLLASCFVVHVGATSDLSSSSSSSSQESAEEEPPHVLQLRQLMSTHARLTPASRRLLQSCSDCQRRHGANSNACMSACYVNRNRFDPRFNDATGFQNNVVLQDPPSEYRNALLPMDAGLGSVSAAASNRCTSVQNGMCVRACPDGSQRCAGGQCLYNAGNTNPTNPQCANGKSSCVPAGEWSAWDSCDAASGTMTRSRPMGGGACISPVETQVVRCTSTAQSGGGGSSSNDEKAVEATVLQNRGVSDETASAWPGLSDEDISRAMRIANSAGIAPEKLLATLSKSKIQNKGVPRTAATRASSDDPELERLIIQFYDDEDYYYDAAPGPGGDSYYNYDDDVEEGESDLDNN
ncbi:hypothetical protein RI054_20g89440 [Pseudoscourfieldia marina]